MKQTSRHSPEPQHFYKSLHTLKDQFSAAVRLFEQDQTQDAAERAHESLSGLNELLKGLARAYKDSLLENKFKTLESDTDSASEIRSAKPSQESNAALMMILIRTEKSIRRAEKEIKWIHPRSSKTIQLFRKYGKMAAWGTLAVLIGTVLFRLESRKHGLVGEYFKDVKLEKLDRKRVDSEIDFTWGLDGPFKRRDKFSIRWNGTLLVPEDGAIEFSVRSDDGSRLWIGDQLLIDDWTTHPSKTTSATAPLTKGPHPIRLEYFENARHASVKLYWKRPLPTGSGGEARPEIIDSRFLVPDIKYLKQD